MLLSGVAVAIKDDRPVIANDLPQNVVDCGISLHATA